MLNDFYFANLVECTSTNGALSSSKQKSSDAYRTEVNGEFKSAGFGIFVIEDLSKLQFKDILSGNIYTTVTSKNLHVGSEYIDIDAGLIPFMKYLEYSFATRKDIREWKKIIRAYEKMKKYEKKLNREEAKFSKIDDKIMTIGGLSK